MKTSKSSCPLTRSPLSEKQLNTFITPHGDMEEDKQIKPTQKQVKSDCFVINFGAEKSKNGKAPKGKSSQTGKSSSLQDAFKKFRKNRQDDIRQNQLMRERELATKCDPQRMWALRMKFLEQAKQYFGVPYAKKYHQLGTPEYDSPLFLDCCGLVRRVLLDLRKDFGFKVGTWNQAYHYDTLPITLTEEEMKPGDLVFISGTYFSKKSRKQKHDMVHVEIWLGDGPKTIGARWQRGKVQVFDSYQFVSKSYHSMVYHFKSIDTWLQGICRSHCEDHPWTVSKYKPGKNSIFTPQEQQEEQEGQAADASDEEEELGEKARREEETGDMQTKEEREHVKVDGCQEFRQDRSTCHYMKGEVGYHGDRNGDAAVEDDLTSLDDEFPCEMDDGDDGSDVGDDEYDDDDDKIMESTSEAAARSNSNIPEALLPTSQENISPNPNSNNNNNSHINSPDVCYHGNLPVDAEGDDATSSRSAAAGGSVSSEDASQGKRPAGSKDKKPDNGGKKKGNNGRGGAGGKSPSEPSGRKSVMQVDTAPTFYIGGNNGVSLVEEPLTARGWHRITEKHSNSFKLKWVELRSGINYNTFKPGEQLVNRIPNSGILATKTGLFNTLREYERICERTKGNRGKQGLPMEEFFPESYILDLKPDREAFFETFKEGEIWICKPNGMNQGKGIYLVRDIATLREKYRARDEAASSKQMQRRIRGYAAGHRLIQRYIPNPLLLNNKKFDVRTYMLIACTNPFVVFYHTGYLRLSCERYDPDSHDLTTHLTNQYQQKKNPNYQENKEETVWSMDRFNDHVNETLASDKGLPKDWVFGFFQKRMCQIMTQCFLASKNKLEARLGYFDLLGFDFMIDTNMKVWLIEINVNPAMHTNCEALRNILPGMIEETLDVVLEIFHKSKNRQPVMPLKTQRHLQLLFNAESGGSVAATRPPTRKAMTATPSPATRPRKSVSPQRAMQLTKSKSPGHTAPTSPGRKPPVVRMTLRKNVTSITPPTPPAPQATDAANAAGDDGVKQVTSKVNAIRL